MIYVDTSVVLASLLAEDHSPNENLWREEVVSSRLIEYETMVRLHAMDLSKSHVDAARDLLNRLAFVELNPVILERILERFPSPVRTLDAIHLTSCLYLKNRDQKIQLATYDKSMMQAAKKLGLAQCLDFGLKTEK